MILVALGSNMSGPWGDPTATVQRALVELNRGPSSLVKASRLITTKPFGVTAQPDFINAIAQIETDLSPDDLLAHLHDIESRAGRKRTLRWGPRTLDLDLIDYHGLVQGNGTLILPHPGIAERKFVLEPIAEIAPEWRHPVSRMTAANLLSELR